LQLAACSLQLAACSLQLAALRGALVVRLRPFNYLTVRY
jgi:hypothetical protein